MQAHGLAGLDVLVQAVGIVPRLTAADETARVLDAVADDRPGTGKRKRANNGWTRRRKPSQPFKRLQALEVPREIAAPKPQPQTKRQRMMAADPVIVPQPPYVAPANRDVATTEAEAWGAFLRSLGKGKRSEAMDRALELADTKMAASVDEWIKFYQCSRRVQPLKLRAALNLALNLNQHITTVFPQKGTHPKALDRDVRGLALHAPCAVRAGSSRRATRSTGTSAPSTSRRRRRRRRPGRRREDAGAAQVHRRDNAYWRRRGAWREGRSAVRAIRKAAPNLKTPLRIAQAQQMLAMIDEDRATCIRAKDANDVRRLEELIDWVMACCAKRSPASTRARMSRRLRRLRRRRRRRRS